MRALRMRRRFRARGQSDAALTPAGGLGQGFGHGAGLQLQFVGGRFAQGLRARCGQCLFDRVAHRLVHGAAVAKAHLDFGRVHVHIDQGRIDLHEQGVGRLLVAVQHVFVGAAGAVHDHLVAHKAAVHVGELVVRARAGGVGCTGSADDVHRADLEIHRDGLRHKLVAQHIGQPLLQTGHARVHAPLFDELALVPDGKAHIGTGQRVTAHGLDAVRQLGAVAFEEFAARRGGEEQFLDFHRGAHRTRRRAHFAGAAIERKGAGLAVHA